MKVGGWYTRVHFHLVRAMPCSQKGKTISFAKLKDKICSRLHSTFDCFHGSTFQLSPAKAIPKSYNEGRRLVHQGGFLLVELKGHHPFLS